MHKVCIYGTGCLSILLSFVGEKRRMWTEVQRLLTQEGLLACWQQQTRHEQHHCFSDDLREGLLYIPQFQIKNLKIINVIMNQICFSTLSISISFISPWKSFLTRYHFHFSLCNGINKICNFKIYITYMLIYRDPRDGKSKWVIFCWCLWWCTILWLLLSEHLSAQRWHS